MLFNNAQLTHQFVIATTIACSVGWWLMAGAGLF
jgi:hypothetical protein